LEITGKDHANISKGIIFSEQKTRKKLAGIMGGGNRNQDNIKYR
jgi:hypothetical protein